MNEREVQRLVAWAAQECEMVVSAPCCSIGATEPTHPWISSFRQTCGTTIDAKG